MAKEVSAEKLVKDIRRKTRRRFSAEEKVVGRKKGTGPFFERQPPKSIEETGW